MYSRVKGPYGRKGENMGERWSKERIWDWYNARPWVMGCNYVPAITIHGMELWIDDTREEVLECVKKELDLLESCGMNAVRMFFSFQFWYFERDKFFRKMDELLELLDSHGVTLMPVIFNDCSSFVRPDPVFPAEMPKGWQPYALGHHGGAVENPFIGDKLRTGWILFDEEEWVEPLFEYEKEFITRYKDDPRILAWDLWNEPGNSNRHTKSIDKLERAFAIARQIDPIQPLTAGPWQFPAGYGVDENAKLETIQRRALDLSDLVTFHLYESFEEVKNATFELMKEGRPMMNTEWMNRILNNNLLEILPFFHEHRIGSYHWGLVAGKSQHFLPWDYLREIEGLDCTKWQHDMFHEDFTPYDEREIALLKELSPRKEK